MLALKGAKKMREELKACAGKLSYCLHFAMPPDFKESVRKTLAAARAALAAEGEGEQVLRVRWQVEFSSFDGKRTRWIPFSGTHPTLEGARTWVKESTAAHPEEEFRIVRITERVEEGGE